MIIYIYHDIERIGVCDVLLLLYLRNKRNKRNKPPPTGKRIGMLLTSRSTIKCEAAGEESYLFGANDGR